MANKYVPPHQRGANVGGDSSGANKPPSFSSNVNNTSVPSNPARPSSTFSSHYSSHQMTYNKPQESNNNYANPSYPNKSENTQTNNNEELNFAPNDSTKYDLGFGASNGNNNDNNNTNNTTNNNSSTSYNNGGNNGYNNSQDSQDNRFRRFRGGRGGSGGGGGMGGGMGRGRGRGRGGGGGRGRGRDNRNNNNRFSRFGNNNNTNMYSNNNNNNSNQSTYTDRYSSNAMSTERNEALERELFGDSNTIQQGINFKNYDDIPVEVSGRDAPPAATDFKQSGLCDMLMANITLCHYSTPTPIQKHSIPCVTQHRDLMACAQTGSGKTAAFLLPIIHNLCTGSKYSHNPSASGYNNREVYPSAVILSPTRELAIQIHVQARKFLYRTGLRTCVVYGGADWRKQARDLRYGVDIIVATPGRLMDFMERGFVKMSAVQYNVLDEADRMLDMGFMPQIKQIISEMPPKDQQRQTLMFSATFPLEIQKLAQDFLNDYIFVAVGRVGSTNTFIDQKLKFVEEYDKTNKLIETVNQMTKTDSGGIPLTLIFVEKKKDAARVEKELIRSGYDAMSIHGDRTQREREHALKMFRMGKVSLLVATDVASRGLDIPNVMFVINYDLPNNIDAYVHRIGRTGRCGNSGNAISFVNEGNKPVIKTLMSLLKESKSEIPQWFADLYYKYSSYNYSGYGKNKYGKYGNNSGGYGKKFGARDYRHGQRGGGGGGYKRNTYNSGGYGNGPAANTNANKYNPNANMNNNNMNTGGNSNTNSNTNSNSNTNQHSQQSNNNITDSW